VPQHPDANHITARIGGSARPSDARGHPDAGWTPPTFSTSTPRHQHDLGDVAETKAVKQVFGEHAER